MATVNSLYYRTDGWLKTANGQAVAGAQVYVTQDQFINLTNPPSPLAQVYSDNAGVNLITQPIITDGFGHYNFYALQGFYGIVIINAGNIVDFLPDQVVGPIGAVGEGTVTNNSGPLPFNQVIVGGPNGGSDVASSGIAITSLTTLTQLLAAIAPLAPTLNPAFTGTATLNGTPLSTTYSNFHNVLAYGATGNGITDDTAAIQAAMTAAASAGLGIYIPTGLYKISSTLTATGLAGILGDSPNSSVLVGTTLTTNAMQLTGVNNILNPGAVSVGFHLENFSVTGPGMAGGANISGIVIEPGIIYQQATIKSVSVYRFPKYGISFPLMITSTFDTVVCFQNGITNFYNSTPGSTSLTFRDCYAVGGSSTVPGVVGYYLNQVEYGSFTGCACDDCNDSYFFQTCNGINMAGCGNESNSFVSGALPGRGIILAACNACTVTGHFTTELPNAASIGVAISSSANIAVIGFYNFYQVTPSQTYDITIDAASSYCSVVNSMNSVNPVCALNDLGTNDVQLNGGVVQGTLNTGAMRVNAATPVGGSSGIAFGANTGVGNSTAANLTALAKGTGSGPTSDAATGWLKINVGGTTAWLPYFE